MKKQIIATASRSQATRAAIGSVRAEGLKPSVSTRRHLKNYSSGKITAAQLHKVVLGEVTTLVKRSSAS